jgi:hypothetical protein
MPSFFEQNREFPADAATDCCTASKIVHRTVALTHSRHNRCLPPPH